MFLAVLQSLPTSSDINQGHMQCSYCRYIKEIILCKLLYYVVHRENGKYTPKYVSLRMDSYTDLLTN